MKILLFAFLFLFLSCAHRDSKNSYRQASSLINEGFNAVLHEYTEGYKKLDPFYASIFGVEEDLGKFGDYPSPSFFARERNLLKTTADKLRFVIPGLLSKPELLTFYLLKEDVELALRGLDFPFELLSFNQFENRLLEFLDESNPELTNFPFDTVNHYEAFLKKADGFPKYIENQIEVLKRGVKEKIVLNCIVAMKTPNTYREALESNIEKNPFWRPISVMPATFPKSARDRLVKDFRIMIEKKILPSVHQLDDFFHKEYIPHCRKTDGLAELPKGKEWYQYSIESNTHFALDAKAIHEMGLAEVERIEKDLESIKKEFKYKGSLKSWMTSLLLDKRNFFSSPDEMKEAYEKVKAKVQKVIPRYFRTVARADYKIVEASNQEDAAARYNPPNENSPFGRFVVNTKNLRAIPKYKVTTLSLHEAIPGHHFQLSLQFEQRSKLSEYQRKIFSSNSFAEGWALYCESLGNEMGLFEDPLQKFGNRNDEMLRAVRLVVDTGIHAFGWSHQRVVEYMKDHLALDEKDIENEANRYSVIPGQALGYKLGEMKIKELRALALSKFKHRFDIREFHQLVIGSGSVTLSVLERRVKDWIDGKITTL